VAQPGPSAPAAARRRAISTHLCDFAWGRSATPSVLARAAMVAMLRSSASRSRIRAGVLTWSRRIEAPRIVVVPADGDLCADARQRAGMRLREMDGDLAAIAEA